MWVFSERLLAIEKVGRVVSKPEGLQGRVDSRRRGRRVIDIDREQREACIQVQGLGWLEAIVGDWIIGVVT